MPSNSALRHLRLEPFSLRFASWLFNERPDLLKYASGVENEVDGLSVYTLKVDIPSENPAVAEPLTLDVDLDRILTIRWFCDPRSRGQGPRWDWDHVSYMKGVYEHLPEQQRADLEFGFKCVRDDLEALLSERAVAFWSSEGYGLSRLEERNPAINAGGYNWIVVRSWHGTHDRLEGISSF